MAGVWKRIRDALFFLFGLILFVDEVFRDENGPGWFIILISLSLMGAVTGEQVVKLIDHVRGRGNGNHGHG